jgi:hypothetical protein
MILFERRSLPAYVVVACVALGIGYFAGREHIKYQIRSTFSAAATRLQTGLAAALGGSLNGETKRSTRSEASPSKTETSREPSPINARLLKKSFLGSDIQERRYEDFITLSIEFNNGTGKDVRAFEGVFTFSDLLDNKILGSRIAISDPVKAGAKYKWDGELNYNQFIASHKKLRSEEQQNLKTSFEIRKILFADGTTQKFD